MLQKTEYDWQYYIEKSDKASLGMKTGCFWPRGKLLGGSSGINAMLYVRGNRWDYDQWEELGNKGWKFQNILKYFKKAENNTVSHEDAGWASMHGKNGPLYIDYFFSYDPIKDMLSAASSELNLPFSEDINGESQMGFGIAQGTIKRGKRQSTATAYLVPAKNRPNLHIIKHAHVTKVNVNDRGLAEGIQFILNGKKLKAKANLETILSAGAIGSPHILLNSGIGDKEHLKKVGVSVNKHLPGVGKNLQDHTIVLVPIKLHKSWARKITESDWVDDAYHYFQHGVGQPSHVGTLDMTAFHDTRNASSELPDVQYQFFQYRMGEEEKLNKALDNYGFDDEINESIKKVITNSELLVAAVVLLRPKSKGRLELRSKDPLDKPRIYGNYLEETEDVETLIRGVSLIKRIVLTNTARDHECFFVKVNITGCAHIEFDKPGYWECYVRHMTTTIYHPTSTAHMGPNSDPVRRKMINFMSC